MADWVTHQLGSWRFIIFQSCLLAVWVALNVLAWLGQWDPYPFILLNLALSFQAAYAAPIILMSQNRQAAKDRMTAEFDFEVDRLAEREISALLVRLDELSARQGEMLLEIQRQQVVLLTRLEKVHGETNESALPGAKPTGRANSTVNADRGRLCSK